MNYETVIKLAIYDAKNSIHFAWYNVESLMHYIYIKNSIGGKL